LYLLYYTSVFFLFLWWLYWESLSMNYWIHYNCRICANKWKRISYLLNLWSTGTLSEQSTLYVSLG
jgi:hypothetical protein